MFEAYIVGLLQEYLGSFVKPNSLQKERLRADVYNGHVCLENLELNPSCLDFLNLPLALIKGYIGQIELKISPCRPHGLLHPRSLFVGPCPETAQSPPCSGHR